MRMKCFTRKAISSIYLMVEIAIILSAIVFIGILMDKTTGITGRVAKESAITKEAEILDITGVTGIDATDGKVETLVIKAETEGSIDLKDCLVIINVGNVSARLQYRNGTLVQDMESGYYTR